MTISRLRGIAKARLQIADQVDDMLTRLANMNFYGGGKRSARYEEKVFEEILGGDLYWLGSEAEALTPNHEILFVNPDAMPGDNKALADICWPIDVANIVRKEAGEDEDPGKPGGFFMDRIRSITPQEARGRAQYFVPKMVRQSYAKLYDDGTWFAEDNIAGLLNERWRLLDRNMTKSYRRGGAELLVVNVENEKIRNEVHETIAVTISSMLTRRYMWHVALGASRDGTRILLPTSPRGCLKFFKDRDLESNRSRRAALRHWVVRHYRDTDTSMGLVFVREHLRGHTEFSWSNLQCEIFVSAFDLEKNEAFRLEAEHWRSQRKHNSVRVRLKR